MSPYRSATAIAQVISTLPIKVHRPHSWQVDDAINAPIVSVQQQLQHHISETERQRLQCQHTIQQAVKNIACKKPGYGPT
jgi:Co/Zn/Cd efflux system component